MTIAIDPDDLQLFIDLLFRKADRGSYVSLRAFRDDADSVWHPELWPVVQIDDNLDAVIEAACRFAADCAKAPEAVCFAPPIATFSRPDKADTASLSNGLVISAELDQRPLEAQERLENVIGPATIAMNSGGVWLNETTGEYENKVHLHWLLAEPTRTKIDHDFLRECNRLVCKIAGGDPTAISLVHPLRWAGSVHRKAAPRLASIVQFNPTIEVTLAEVLNRLRAVTEAQPVLPPKPTYANGADESWPTDMEDLVAAIAVIPNDDTGPGSWEQWNNMGLRLYAATEGGTDGEKLFIAWSKKSAKHDEGNTRARWKHYASSPPDKTGMGKIVLMARAAQPALELPSEKRRREAREASISEFEERPVPPGAPGGVGTTSPSLGESVTLDDFRAYMPTHTYIYMPSRDLWAAASVNGRLPPVKVGTDEQGDPILISAARWLDQNQPVEQMTWAPGLPEIVENRLIIEGGWVERNGVSCFNLYMPPTLPRGDPGKAGPWLDHVRLIYPDDAEHLLSWFAHRVQHPEEKINHGLILSGPPGIGKDTMLEPVKRAIGPWNFQEASPLQVLGRFNGFLKAVILRISEIKDLGETDRYTFYEHMKAYTAAPPDVLRCDEKNIREHAIRNVCGVVYTTNYKAEGLYLPGDDRRHYVAWSRFTKEDFDDAYWNALWSFFDSGGDGHVAAYLAQRDLSAFNPKAPPPKTDAFWDIVNAHRPSETAELQDALDSLGNPDAVTLREVITAEGGNEDFTNWLKDRKNRTKIPHRFEECGYTPVRNPDADDGLWRIRGRREVVYSRTAYAPQARFAAAEKLR